MYNILKFIYHLNYSCILFYFRVDIITSNLNENVFFPVTFGMASSTNYYYTQVMVKLFKDIDDVGQVKDFWSVRLFVWLPSAVPPQIIETLFYFS